MTPEPAGAGKPATLSVSSPSSDPRPPSLTLQATDRILDALVDDLSEVVADALGSHEGSDLAPSGTLDWDLVGELDLMLRRRGKRIRPIAAHWGWVAGGGPQRPGSEIALARVCAALDLLHLFALVQDDVMDRSDTRRGAPTVHRTAARRHTAADGVGDAQLFGDSVAILLSDLALSEASMLVAETPAPVRSAWRAMSVELVQGQLLDVTHTAMRRRDPDGARLVARLKSGRYTVTRPVELGALAAGAEQETIDHLRRWGDLVGDAFAIRDDLLGVWGDPGITGKPAGDDLVSGKPTVLLSWAEQMLPEEAQPLLERCGRGELDPAGVAALQRVMKRAGVRARAEEQLDDLLREADRALDALGLDAPTRTCLAGLADRVAWRVA